MKSDDSVSHAKGDGDSPYFVDMAQEKYTGPAFRWRVIPCFFLGSYGLGIILNVVVHACLISIESLRGREFRIFKRMTAWPVSMLLAFGCGVALLVACRSLWRKEWQMTGLSILISIVVGALFFLLTNGLHTPR
jgi:hypothetical protein